MGLERLSWDDVAKFTAGRVTKARVSIASKKGISALNNPNPPPPPPTQTAQKPAKSGREAPETSNPAYWDTLTALGREAGLNAGQFWGYLCERLGKKTPDGEAGIAAFKADLTESEIKVLTTGLKQLAAGKKD